MMRCRPSAGASPAHAPRSAVRIAGLVATCALVLLTATLGRAAQAPKPWRPGASAPAVSRPDSAGPSVPGQPGAHAPVPAPPPVEPPPGTIRLLDLSFNPNVPDTVLPLAPVYVELKTVEILTRLQGTLHQGSPQRDYPIVVPRQSVHVDVDGQQGQSQLAIVLVLPWFGDVLPLSHCEAKVGIALDGEAERVATLMFTPGPVLFDSDGRPLPVSNPGLLAMPLPAGKHRVTLSLRETPTPYVLLLLGQPRLSPLPLSPRSAAR